MRTSTVIRTTVAIVVGAAIAWPLPAAAQDGTAGAPDRAGSSAPSDEGQPVVLRRDGDRAVAFTPAAGGGNEPVLRRDGSQAAPFVADVGPQAIAVDASFHWDDALVGAAGAVALMLLASIAWTGVQRRRRASVGPARAA
jgi:hypothetical protein